MKSLRLTQNPFLLQREAIMKQTDQIPFIYSEENVFIIEFLNPKTTYLLL
jgi:hypothetical protein